MQIQKMALYNIDWQVLRVSLSFSSMETVQASCNKLLEYMNDDIIGYDTRSNKLWRVINLLNAAVMGLNGQLKLAKTEEREEVVKAMITFIQMFRTSWQEEYHSSDKQFRWDEAIEWSFLEATPRAEVEKVLQSLVKRKNFAAEFKKMQVSKTRPELLKYLEMLHARLN